MQASRGLKTPKLFRIKEGSSTYIGPKKIGVNDVVQAVVSDIDKITDADIQAYFQDMTRTFDIEDAKARLFALVDEAERGEEIVITENGAPKARLVSIGQPIALRKPSGLLRIRHIASDFDAPDEGLARSFEGEA